MESESTPIGLALLRGVIIGIAITTLASWSLSLSSVVRGGAVGLAFAAAFEPVLRLLRRRMRSWAPPQDPETAARKFILLLLGTWAIVLALVLPLMHFGIGIPVLHSWSSALPTAAISLAWLSVVIVREVSTDLIHRNRMLAETEARARYLALEAQLQPHTLFNALNTIISQCREDPLMAEEAARRLAGLMRGILSGLEKEHWTLSSEIGVVGDLLHLEKLRFGDRLQADIRLPESLAKRSIPPLLLLPLVENSLKHGFRRKVGACHVVVDVSEDRIRVEDDGTGRSPESKDGIGLGTVRQRAQALGWTLEWPQVDEGCAVELRWN